MFFLQNSFHFPESFAKALHSAIWKSAIPNELELKKRGESLRLLWPKLAKDLGTSEEAEKHYSEKRDQTLAYASYYLPANAPKIPLILEEAHLLGLDILADQNRWLDFGSGPGTALWGAAWWAKARNRSFQFTGFEQSPHFLETAQSFARELREYHPAHQATFTAFQGRGAKSLDKILDRNPAEIISFMNSFHEFFPTLEEKTAAGTTILRSLKNQSRKDGKARWFLLIEPASKKNSRDLASCLRAWQDAKLGQVLLPCFSDRACGALANPKDWCHEAVDCAFPEWVEDLGQGAGLRKESVLFSYAVISVGMDHPNWPKETKRMVSQRLEQKGQTEAYFCCAEGKVRCRVQHAKTSAETEYFHHMTRGTLLQELSLGEKSDVAHSSKLPTKVESLDDLFPPI